MDIPELEIIDDAVFLEYSFNAVVDKDGEPSVAIKIISNLDDLAYESNNGVIKVDSKTPGQDIVYLSLDERLLTIYHKGFKPKKVILRQLGIKATPRSMWKIEVSGHKREGLNEKRGTITVRSTPPNAKISISGLPDFEGNTPNTFTDYLAQPYQLKLSKQYFDDIDTVMVIGEGDNPPMDLTLKTTNAGLIVNSIPTGASVYLGDKYLGRTPKKFTFPEERLTPGNYNLKLTYYPFYQEILEPVVLIADSVLTKDFELVDLSSYVTFTGNVFPLKTSHNAQVHRNINLGDQIRLPSGKYEFSISKEGDDSKYYRPKQLTRTLLPGIEYNVDATLQNMSAWIVIENAQVPVELLINGTLYPNRSVGESVHLTYGYYEIIISKNGTHKKAYEKKTVRISVDAGERKGIDCSLKLYTGHLSCRSNTNGSLISVYDIETSKIIFEGKEVNNLNLAVGEYLVSSTHPKYGDSPSKRVSVKKDMLTNTSLAHSLTASKTWKIERAQIIKHPRSFSAILQKNISGGFEPFDSTTSDVPINDFSFGLGQKKLFFKSDIPDTKIQLAAFVFEEILMTYDSQSKRLLDISLIGFRGDYSTMTSDFSHYMSVFIGYSWYFRTFNVMSNYLGDDYILLESKYRDDPENRPYVWSYTLRSYAFPVIGNAGIEYIYTPKNSNAFSIGITVGITVRVEGGDYNWYNKSQYDSWEKISDPDKYYDETFPYQLDKSLLSVPGPLYDGTRYVKVFWVFH